MPLSGAWSTSLLTFETGAVGSNEEVEDSSERDFPEGMHLDFTGRYYYGWDQMVLIGFGGGYQQWGERNSIPLMGSMIVRLPIGSLFLPAVQGDIGYAIGFRSGFFYRFASGVDMRLGDRSSLIAFGGMQNHFDPEIASQVFLRGGLLLEF